jgi:putative endopeptidase
MTDYEKHSGVCTCGTLLPEAPAYFEDDRQPDRRAAGQPPPARRPARAAERDRPRTARDEEMLSMVRRLKWTALLLTGLVVALRAQSDAPRSIQVASLDRSCKPCDDFWRFANGSWLDANPIPAAYASWGPSAILARRNRDNLRSILDGLAARANVSADSNEGRLAALYGSCMDTATIDRRDLEPLKPELAQIDAVRSRDDLRALLVRYQGTGRPSHWINGQVIGFFRLAAGVDPDNPARVIARLVERDSSGRTPSSVLSLPDRDFYLNEDARSRATRDEFQRHVETLLTMAGSTSAAGEARTVVAFETAIAKAALKNSERRDPLRVYHPMSLADLRRLAPDFDWAALLREAGLPDSATINVTEPDLIAAGDRLLADTPIPEWKTWLRWRVLKMAAPYLAARFADEDFRFERTVLAGITEPLPRWDTCVQLVDRDLSDALGPLWVAKYFPPESKRRIEALVDGVKAAMRDEIQASAWMQPATKRAAVAKLDALRVQVGYPPAWLDYAGIRLDRGTFYENVRAAWRDLQRHQWAQIGGPTTDIDWAMTASTVNAYSNPTELRLVFPAGYLQPPYFDPAADDAVNYAGIGATIGHELGHQFDDGGSKYDATGRLREWWSAEDRQQFTARAACVIDQFDGIDVGDGLRHNGRLVAGEAMGDLGGLRVAYRAYHRTLEGKPERVIEGYTPDQRFFIAFAQTWGSQARPDAVRLQLATDNHPLAKYRANATLANMPEFRTAFQCAATDPMVRPAASVCRIW